MPEPLPHQPSQALPHAFAISIHDVRTGPPPEGQLGEGLLLRTDRGDIQALLHPAPEAQYGVIWVGGARGGLRQAGPGRLCPARGRAVSGPDRLPTAMLPAAQRPPRMRPGCPGRRGLPDAGRRAPRGARRALVWRRRGHYRGCGACARRGRRGVSAANLWRTPRGAAGAASAPGGTWESRHAPPIHLRRADLRLGAGAETAGPVRGRRTPLGRMRRRAGPAVSAVDSRHPPLRRRYIIEYTCYRRRTPLSCVEAFSGRLRA